MLCFSNLGPGQVVLHFIHQEATLRDFSGMQKSDCLDFWVVIYFIPQEKIMSVISLQIDFILHLIFLFIDSPFGIQSHHFMANRWGKSRNSDRFLFSCAPKSLRTATAAMKLRHLLLGRKTMSIWKDRDIVSLTKVYIVKAMVFPVVMYGCESRTIMKDECQRMDAFELWCWRRFLRVPWEARRWHELILKEINPEYRLEELMLKLKLHYLATWW